MAEGFYQPGAADDARDLGDSRRTLRSPFEVVGRAVHDYSKALRAIGVGL